MVEQKVRRRRDFQHGNWVRMGDGQRWMFPHPPAPGTDSAYDALIRCLHEAEDADEALKVELAIGILLLSRNYDPKPDEYEAIFSFGDDQATRSAAQAAISELIYKDLEERCIQCRPQQSPFANGRTVFGAFQMLFHSCAVRLRSMVAKDRAAIDFPVTSSFAPRKNVLSRTSASSVEPSERRHLFSRRG